MQRWAMALCAVAGAVSAPQPAAAQDPFKLAVIDPRSGGAAALGARSLSVWEYLRDEANGAGGINGAPLELIPYDNKAKPAESLVNAQNAVDRGARFLTQAAGSAVAGAMVEFVRKYNDRHAG